jgi:hypothetical protein
MDYTLLSDNAGQTVTGLNAFELASFPVFQAV